MGHRLSKITTRTGDAGETGLGDGARVAKDSARIVALGDIDELNSAIGVVLAEEVPAQIRAVLEQVQHDLFDLGGELSIPGHALLTEAQVAALAASLERWHAVLAPLKELKLPGGVALGAWGYAGLGVDTRCFNTRRAHPDDAAAAHLARTVCRRAERTLVALGRGEPVGEPARRYLNRLSDLLFVAGRSLNRAASRGDVQWRHRRKS
jgi:cob(I)alamin adenosyltransferase